MGTRLTVRGGQNGYPSHGERGLNGYLSHGERGSEWVPVSR